jgi:hypothetical protein
VAGIAEALITTAFGILVAVIAVMFFNFLLNSKLIKSFCGCFTCFAVQGKKKEVEKIRR